MIYFVDEDRNEMRPFRQELAMRGFNTRQLFNADDGFNALFDARDVELAIIDVMLSTDDVKSSRFSRDETNNFLITGLVLVRDLFDQAECLCKKLFPKKIILYSHATEINLVQKIQKVALDYGILYLSKNDYDNPFEFANKIEEIIGRKNELL